MASCSIVKPIRAIESWIVGMVSGRARTVVVPRCQSASQVVTPSILATLAVIASAQLPQCIPETSITNVCAGGRFAAALASLSRASRQPPSVNWLKKTMAIITIIKKIETNEAKVW